MSFKFFNNTGQELVNNSIADLPIGTIVDYGGETAPNGWLKCDGTAVSRTDYTDLYAAFGTYFGSGNGTTTFNLPDISGSIVYAIANSKRVATSSPPQFVSTLPASPVSGQEIYYQASGSMAASGITWHLRYNASSSSAYKWEFLGGSRLVSQDNAQAGPAAPSANTWFDVGTAISITAPLSGDYLIEASSSLYRDSSNTNMLLGIKNDTTEDAFSTYVYGPNSQWSSTSLSTVITVASTKSVTLRYRTDQAATNFYRKGASLLVTPVRVG